MMREIDYSTLDDAQASAARFRDKGQWWQICDSFDTFDEFEALREAMHDRDRFQRERDYWREQAEGGANG